MQSNYKLFESVAGVCKRDGVTIPAGSIVQLPIPRIPNIGMIDVDWNGDMITVALIDVEIRATLVQDGEGGYAASAGAG
jgi:hypothetical protein